MSQKTTGWLHFRHDIGKPEVSCNGVEMSLDACGIYNKTSIANPTANVDPIPNCFITVKWSEAFRDEILALSKSYWGFSAAHQRLSARNIPSFGKKKKQPRKRGLEEQPKNKRKDVHCFLLTEQANTYMSIP